MKRLLFACLLFLKLSSSCFAQVDTQDSLALVDLYQSTYGPGWTNSTGWLTTPVSNWFGITIQGSRVTRLDLPDNNLQGTLTNSIGNLTGLLYLNLNNSKLFGSLPSSIGNLINVIQISMSGIHFATNSFPDAGFTGDIPASIGNLTHLTLLDLSFNRLISIPSSMGNLKELTNLNLSTNKLSGPIPFLPNLNELNITQNEYNNFDIIEGILQSYPFAIYSPQFNQYANISGNGSKFIVHSGGAPNNTYTWYKSDYPYISDSLIFTIVGDSTFIIPPSISKYIYTVKVTNSIAPQLSLSGEINPLDTIECGHNAAQQHPKISFKGKAPQPWAIDGSVKDWETIFGPGTGNAVIPYLPPQNSSFNWSYDGYKSFHPIVGLPDQDKPTPQRDIIFSGFTHDDYNVYFYFRRLLNGDSSNTFLYFCDVDADGLMNTDEPVFSGKFTANSISALTLSRYIADTTTSQDPLSGIYVPKRGNDMLHLYHQFTNRVDRNPMTGTLKKLFDANSIPSNEKLRKNEVFKAALTENGYGVELAVPWRYLKYWKKRNYWRNRNNNALKPGQIFFYKTELQAGTGKYSRDSVVDNAGDCCNSIVRSGIVDIKKSITTTELIPGTSYHFNLKYKNLTNAETAIWLQSIIIDNIQLASIKPAFLTDFKATVYDDLNCNGRVDSGEDTIQFANFLVNQSIQCCYENESTCCSYINGRLLLADSIELEQGGYPSYSTSLLKIPRYEKACFIVDLNMSSPIVSANIKFENSVIFDGPWFEYCDIGGGKAINPIGTSQTSIGSTKTAVLLDTSTVVSKIAITNTNNLKEKGKELEVSVFPNPSNGTATVLLQNSIGGVDIFVDDFMGRTIQKWNNFSSNKIQLVDLKKGIYLIRIHSRETGKETRKKLVVL